MRESDDADPSASTAQFRAFADQAAGPDTTQQWAMHGPRQRGPGLIAAVAGAVVVIGIVVLLLVH